VAVKAIRPAQSVHELTVRPQDGASAELVHRIAPDWGHPLSASDCVDLERSWISSAMAEAAMLRRVDAETGRTIVGQKGKRDCAGILIPYYSPGDSFPHSYRIRRRRQTRKP